MKRILGVVAVAAVMMTATVTEAKAQNYHTQTTQRKVWSQRATGAVVGAGSGAVIGALVNRNNRAGGAAIGTVVGAGIGYLIGQREDRMNPQPNTVYKTKTYDQYGRVVDRSKQYSYDRNRTGYANRNNNRYNHNAGYRYR